MAKSSLLPAVFIVDALFVNSFQRLGQPVLTNPNGSNYRLPRFDLDTFLDSITRATVNKAVWDTNIHKAALVSNFSGDSFYIKQVYESMGFMCNVLHATDRKKELRCRANDSEYCMGHYDYNRTLQSVHFGYILGVLHQWTREKDPEFQPSNCVVLVRPHLTFVAEMLKRFWSRTTVHVCTSENYPEKEAWSIVNNVPDTKNCDLDYLAAELPVPRAQQPFVEKKFGTRIQIPENFINP